MRKITNKLLDLVDEGMLTWEQIAQAALSYMSEDDVADMAHDNELILKTDGEDEDDIDALLDEEDEDEDDPAAWSDEEYQRANDEAEELARYAEADAVDAALARMINDSK